MESLLPDLSQAIAGTVDVGSNGVVQVDGRSRIPASGVLWSKDGVIVTAHHVVERDEGIEVSWPRRVRRTRKRRLPIGRG